MSEPTPADIEALTALFQAGGWVELRVSTDGFSLLLSNDSGAHGLDRPSAAGNPVFLRRQEPRITGGADDTPGLLPAQEHMASSEAVTVDRAWRPIVAPNLGTFYRSPKPGSPPFVEIGQHVDADSEVCLVEVMKLFTAVSAGVAGTIRAIVAQDGALVENGATLFHIEPDEG